MHPTHRDTAYPKRSNFTDLTGDTFGLLRVERYADRPGLNRLRDGVQANAFDAVLILSPDRLSRKCVDLVRMLEEFERFATPVVFVEQPDFDKTSGDDKTDACPLTLDPLPRPEGVRA